ncbi:hypothetical protein NDU88_006133 [Pleurodeles waltl]|uniref:Uncharacterized protein n=1 Tax=Pleurodeles waltl TaxID=8319 RepID=A0AAV7PHZ0_PLEWA|nr:hypothetical protein NDU88_006133 [Pleurodeles waltl]
MWEALYLKQQGSLVHPVLTSALMGHGRQDGRPAALEECFGPGFGIFYDPVPWAPANPVDGSWSHLEWRRGREEHQQPVKGVAIAPRGSACEERLTPRWWPRSRAHFENLSKSTD